MPRLHICRPFDALVGVTDARWLTSKLTCPGLANEPSTPRGVARVQHLIRPAFMPVGRLAIYRDASNGVPGGLLAIVNPIADQRCCTLAKPFAIS
jgi:hypothetical protein